MTRILIVGFTIFAAMCSHLRADWPNFRGPGQQGHAGPGDYPLRWGAKENVGWKTALPGPGASTPVVQGDRVYVTCFTGKKGKELVRHLLCVDRKTGKIVWEEKRAALQPESDYTGQHLQHGFTTPTPAVDKDRIYVNYSRSGVYAFDLAGKELWHRELGTYRNSFGSASSPTLFGDLVLVNASVESSGFYALNKSTGEIVWKAKLGGDGWSTPIVVETAKGEKEIVLNSHAKIVGFDPKNGEELWHCPTVGGYVSTTPVVHKDVLYLIGSNVAKKAVTAIRVGGRGDVSQTHVLWTNTKVGASYTSPLLVGDRLFYFSNFAVCLDRNTGEVLGQSRLDGINNLYSSPIEAGGKIYLLTRTQGAYVLSADAKMDVLAHNEPGDASTINASPAASDGEIFVRSDQYLYCWRRSK